MSSSPTLTERDRIPAAPADTGSKETITQSEVEALLAQVETVAPPSAENDPHILMQSASGEIVRRLDFPKLSPFSASELRPMRVRHEDFISALATRISIHLGLEVGLQLSKLEPMPFHRFTESLYNPTYLTMLKLQPLTGIGLLDIPPRLGLSMVDRELGGPGRVAEESSQIGKIEARLLSTVVSLIVNEWCTIWRDLIEIQPSVLGYEVNSRYLETSTPETIMLVVGMETRISDVVEQMQFAFPHQMLEPLGRKLKSASTTGEKKENAGAKPIQTKWNPFFDGLNVLVRAELPEIQLSAGEVANLKVGDVLPLSAECMNEVHLRLPNHPGFVGTLGCANQRKAVKIEKCLKRDLSSN